MLTHTDLPLESLLGFLEEDEVRCVKPYFLQTIIGEGETFSQPGEEVEGVGFVSRGRLAVTIPTGFNTKKQVVALLAPGAVVGEGVVGYTRPKATVVATTESVVYLLSRKNFQLIQTDYPEVIIKILKHLLTVTHLRLLENSERLAHVL